MSKISEQKALEAYPEEKHITYGMISGGNPFEIDINTRERNGYIKGYDQAMQDFLEKAEEFLYLQLNNGSIECGNIERLIYDFKNHMQDEM